MTTLGAALAAHTAQRRAAIAAARASNLITEDEADMFLKALENPFIDRKRPPVAINQMAPQTDAMIPLVTRRAREVRDNAVYVGDRLHELDRLVDALIDQLVVSPPAFRLAMDTLDGQVNGFLEGSTARRLSLKQYAEKSMELAQSINDQLTDAVISQARTVSESCLDAVEALPPELRIMIMKELVQQFGVLRLAQVNDLDALTGLVIGRPGLQRTFKDELLRQGRMEVEWTGYNTIRSLRILGNQLQPVRHILVDFVLLAKQLQRVTTPSHVWQSLASLINLQTFGAITHRYSLDGIASPRAHRLGSSLTDWKHGINSLNYSLSLLAGLRTQIFANGQTKPQLIVYAKVWGHSLNGPRGRILFPRHSDAEIRTMVGDLDIELERTNELRAAGRMTKELKRVLGDMGVRLHGEV